VPPSIELVKVILSLRLTDLITASTEDYVAKAVQVATDRDYRRYVTGRIAERSDVLFNDLAAVREHERFFEEALANAMGLPRG
jgi:predicted O-linked N-acetylglucosamine transferase (SPINDLY family)